ncbi:alpha/beta hydrolase [Psychrobium sp. MM17-31]|uniref:alpha/beta fold hydrolase n=1 Tax=Psychrobium sp. MM17-31 TaxID=2917758 RepID=UPI001EF4F06B|nr:alpha/beta hydrolase [Psychrobium sp. MM17-31]MCG7531109.1 alpha/beta hydrolase [Psychrobium sp. MM17-31]
MISPTAKQYEFKLGAASLAVTRGGPNTDTSICFIPGWGGDHWLWQQHFEQCSQTHDTLIVDLPGFGRSQVPLSQLTVEASAQLVSAALTDAGIKQCVLVGHSLGGAISLAIAALLGDKAQAVIGVDSLAFNVIYPATSQEGIDEMVNPFRCDYTAAINGLADAYMSENTPAGARDKIAADMLSNDQKTGVTVLETYLAWDRDADLKRYQGPVYGLLAQVHEPIIDHRVTDRIDIEIVDGTGHYIMLDQPDALHKKIDEVLNS